jgi:prepilin-type N-terminal cleavage/methylation domain-containing protein
MYNCRKQKGFSFFELMIAVAVVGTLAAVAIPAYQGYIDTANMTKVTASFEESVRVVTNTFSRRKTKIALGIVEDMPDSTADWITALNPNSKDAPGGGPAFIPSTNQGKGDPITGAIGVKWAGKESKKLELWRPLYVTLTGKKVDISENETKIHTFD